MVALKCTLSHHLRLAHLPHTCRFAAMDLGLKCDGPTCTHSLSLFSTGSSSSQFAVCGKGLGPEIRRLHSHAHSPATFDWLISPTPGSLASDLGLECDGCTHMHTLSTLRLGHLPRTCQCVVKDLGLQYDCCTLTHTLTPLLISSSLSHLAVCGKGPGHGMRWLHPHAHFLTTFDWRIVLTLDSAW